MAKGKLKAFRERSSPVRKLTLPRDLDYEGLSVERAIRGRRSLRDFSPQPLTLPELSHALYYSVGLTAPPFRANPSRGLPTLWRSIR